MPVILVYLRKRILLPAGFRKASLAEEVISRETKVCAFPPMHTSQDKMVMRGRILSYIGIAKANRDVRRLIFFWTDLFLTHFK